MKIILKQSIVITLTMLLALTSCGSALTLKQQKERRTQLLEAKREARSKN